MSALDAVQADPDQALASVMRAAWADGDWLAAARAGRKHLASTHAEERHVLQMQVERLRGQLDSAL